MKFTYYLIPITFVFALVLGSCTSESIVKVEHSGALMQIMSGNTEATISLLQLEDNAPVYALGAVEDLQGEIQIFDGVPYHTSVADSTLVMNAPSIQNASLLVYATVQSWEDVDIPDRVRSKSDFEKFVFATAKEKGISVTEPFPFLISGTSESLSWHVIQWDTRDTEHTHAKHRSSGLTGTIAQRDVDILGFYSENHKGIFTHHSTNMHLHFKTRDGEIAGHVDDFTIGENMILKLPKHA